MAHDTQQKRSQSGLPETYKHWAEKFLMILEELSKLTRQFANKPDLQQLAHMILFTLSGQFTLSDSFSLLRKPGAPDQKAISMATGKFSTSKLLQSLTLTPGLNRYFLEHDSPSSVSELRLRDVCFSRGAILRDCGVELVCPLVHNDKLLGIIGLGKRVTKMPFTSEDIELLDTLISTITPLIASAYHFHEMTCLSAWHLDILNS
ncbi:GAF domain-containing protein, partial [bacterium]|nr:GAF domain-containing protein [bacterium]